MRQPGKWTPTLERCASLEIGDSFVLEGDAVFANRLRAMLHLSTRTHLSKWSVTHAEAGYRVTRLGFFASYRVPEETQIVSTESADRPNMKEKKFSKGMRVRPTAQCPIRDHETRATVFRVNGNLIGVIKDGTKTVQTYHMNFWEEDPSHSPRCTPNTPPRSSPPRPS